MMDRTDREHFGKIVREAWIKWAGTQPNLKLSWLLPWDLLPEGDKEADRQIAEAVITEYDKHLMTILETKKDEPAKPVLDDFSFLDHFNKSYWALVGSSIEQQFNEWARTWRNEMGPVSSVSKMCDHPAYRNIVQMGPTALPLIFHSLALFPNHWFLALLEIVGHSPILPEHRGKIDEMAQDWLKWADEHGYDYGKLG